jgi:hypothetical protein
MSKMLIVAERKWLGKIFFNFFVLIGWRTCYFDAPRRNMKKLKGCNAIILIMRSKQQILSDIRLIKSAIPGLRIVCATLKADSKLCIVLKKEKVKDFFTRDGLLFLDKNF